MEYTVQKLARLAGVSARTLRFYDEIGLLKPARISPSGYRIYGEREVDTLQQILFFRALGLELSAILSILQDERYDRLATLKSHLQALQAKKAQIDLLIESVAKTIAAEEGSYTMTDKEKFEAFKKRLVDENEQKYGQEIREKYGEKTVDESNARMMGLSQGEYEAMQQTAKDIQSGLEAAVKAGDSPEGDAGRDVAALHKRWLSYSWPSYAKEAHLGLVQMYLDDERFTAYYDTNTPGCARFLRDAVTHWIDSL